MAWYPGAEKMELQPESNSQPAIRPTQFIMHSIAAPWTARRMYEYWRDSTNLDSHFGLGYSGAPAQYIGTETRADANASANRRWDGTGAVSIETASNLQHTDPWTESQINELIKLGVWLHKKHGIPLRICRSASDPGFGYHGLYPEWSLGGTACPGAARIKQFKEVVFPGIVRAANGSEWKENPMGVWDEPLTMNESESWGPEATTSAGAWLVYANKKAERAVNEIRDIPVEVLGYRNPSANERSIKETGEQIPDVYGYLVGSNYLIHRIREELGALREEVAELKAKIK